MRSPRPQKVATLAMSAALLFAATARVVAQESGQGAAQISIQRVEQMPSRPQPYLMRDWAKVARDYDAFVFDFSRRGEHLPLIWWDDTKDNCDFRGFGLPSYVGSAYQTRDSQHEAINCMAAVVGATLVGIDKSRQNGHDFVRMCQRYFNKANGVRLYQNHPRHNTGGSFWYETYPSLLFAQLLALYPNAGEMEAQFRASADRMQQAIMALGGERGVPDFDHTAFNYQTMKPVDNGRWREPDAAAGYAWFAYMAYVKTGNLQYLKAADLCMEFLEQRRENPYYESLLPFGALLAARMNAEQGRRYDVRKVLAWCFGPSVSRPQWGVVAGRWGGVEVSGLTGSLDERAGYAFAMNTFNHAGALTPLARYDDRYARAIGKYLLNLANSARLFYANAHADDHQNSAEWAHKHDKDSCIAYEGCRARGRRSAKATADFRTVFGQVVSGDFKATQTANERPQRLEQALRERVVGDCDRLEHIWTMNIPPNVGATLFVEARCQDGGDDDQEFCFSYATKPGGPYEPLFILSADAPQPRVGRGLPQGITGALYVKVEDTDRTPGQTQPDTLHVDALYVLYEIDKSPFGMGDAVGGFPRAIATDLALYGSSHVGYLGGVVKTTDVNGILQLDLLKTDWHAGRAYPSYLYFNPHADPKRVTLDVGPGLRDLYETVTERFVARGVRGPTAVTVPPDAAIVVVLCPAGGNLTHQGHRTLVDGVVVDWSYPTVMIESPKPGEPVRGNTPLRFRVCTPARLPLRQCAVRVDGRLAYSGSAIPPELKLDTAQWQDGFHLVRISAETEGPAFDAVAAEVFFDNGRAAMLFDARTMAAWSKLPGSSAEAAVHEGCAVITSPKQTWAAVLSAPFNLDFDRQPTLLVDIASADPRWFLKLRVEGKGDYYVQGDTSATGIQSLNLLPSIARRHPDAAKTLTGAQTAQLMLGASGKVGSRVAVRSVRVVYAADAAVAHSIAHFVVHSRRRGVRPE